MDLKEKILVECYLSQTGLSHNQMVKDRLNLEIKNNEHDYALSAMEELSKIVAIAFFDYIDRYRKEESVWFHKECKKLGGVFSYMNKPVDKIYDDFINKVPIKSEMVPDGFPDRFYTVDENYNLSMNS